MNISNVKRGDEVWWASRCGVKKVKIYDRLTIGFDAQCGFYAACVITYKAFGLFERAKIVDLNDIFATKEEALAWLGGDK